METHLPQAVSEKCRGLESEFASPWTILPNFLSLRN